MTKNKIAVLAMLLACAAAFAQDAYQDDDAEGSSAPKKEKSSGGGLKSFLLGKSSEKVEIAPLSLFEYTFTGTDVKKTDATVFYDVGEKSAYIALKTVVKYHYYFDRKARDMCKKAYELYLSDFDAKRLIKKNSKTHAIYGRFKTLYKSGAIGTGIEAKPEVTIGYQFVKKSPYFTLTFWPAVINEDTEDGAGSTSRMTLLFTKAQMADLLDTFDEDYFASLHGGGSDFVTADEY